MNFSLIFLWAFVHGGGGCVCCRGGFFFVSVVVFFFFFFFFFFWCVVAMVVVDLSLIFGENHIFRRFSLWSLSFDAFGPYL